jgi:hypothetical protein
MTKLTTRNVDSDSEMCQICGECRRCRHYHDLRDEVTKLRRVIRKLAKAAKKLRSYGEYVASFDEGDDSKNPHATTARHTVNAATKVIEDALAAV